MADNHRRGGLKFSTHVLETIAGIATLEVDGISAMSGGVVEGISERLGRKNLTKGVEVEAGEREVAVDLRVIVEYGRNVPRVYENVVQNVSDAIQQMTGLRVVEVVMYVEGVSFPEESRQTRQEAEQSEPRVR
ncbi:Asp23/Gls24 family envelope stress response protein [Desmospora profundinema]|uniref:Alkaline shock family protein YloU n=1 Tax=Desmospora profundinema TaxID=1571184 RepID=A0ABU1IRG0_9BACL|nr:Asp23/Gls24 family envelope stress response protein [Desmospora profundinema]MDR6227387.1 putative alkaline shock family protein YloU [Desmospora profundinema]